MNPTCPICPGPRELAKNGFNESKTQRYRCTAKGCTYSLSDSPHTQGRPTKWATAMSNADRQAEYRVRREEKRSIENINLEENPMTYPLASFIAALNGDRVHGSMTSDDIEASESAGQKTMIAATQIPKDGDWDLLKSWGVVILGDADELFYNAQLPEGWALRSTEHDLHTDLIDRFGRKRAGLFYKAAHYDRRAEVFVIRNRFIVGPNWSADNYSRNVTQFAIKDLARDTVIEMGSPVRYAVLKNDPSIVGAVKDDVFYFDPTGGNLSKFRNQVPADQSTVLTSDEFYKGYHSGDTWNYEVMDTLENLASDGLEENLVRFLAGHDEWDFA